MDKVTVATLRQMKREGRKIVGTVVYDGHMALIAERAGVDFVSVGDSIGVNLWGHAAEDEVTVEQMLLACRAVRSGVRRALLTCDVPSGPVKEGAEAAVRAATRFVREGGADMVKVHGTAELVRALVREGIAVFAEFHGGKAPASDLVQEALRLQDAGAAMLDFRHSGPEAGEAVAKATAIPVVGGLGGGPWLDGRVRLAHTVTGYGAKWLDSTVDTYVNTARLSLQAFSALVDDVRSGRQVKG